MGACREQFKLNAAAGETLVGNVFRYGCSCVSRVARNEPERVAEINKGRRNRHYNVYLQKYEGS
jgi:hypothetical protein